MSGERVEIYRDSMGFWRWRARAGNHRTIGASEQGYRRRWWCERKARRAYPGVTLVRVEVGS